MNMHSDYNYLVDKALFGSSTKVTSLNNRSVHNQIIFKGDLNNLEKNVKNILFNSGIISNQNSINIINMKDYCIAKFQTVQEAEQAMNAILEIVMKNDLQISVKWYEARDDRNVYVKNLPIDYTEDKLRELFQNFGSIISMKLIKKEKNNNCIGFIRYQKNKEAEKAIIGINKKRLVLIGTDRFVHCELSKVYNTTNVSSHQITENNHFQNTAHISNVDGVYSRYPVMSPVYPESLLTHVLYPQYQYYTEPIQMNYGQIIPIQTYGLPPQQIFQTGNVLFPSNNFHFSSQGPNLF